MTVAPPRTPEPRSPDAAGRSRPGGSRRHEENRARAARLRLEQQRTARRTRTVVLAVLAAAMLMLGVVVAGILSQGATAKLDGVATPAGATTSGGISVGASGVDGTTEAAGADPVVVSVYADYLCPFCASFEEINGEVLTDLRERGEVTVEYHPVAILDRLSAGSQYSTRTATAAALVADRAPDAFVEFNRGLYASQPEENTRGLTDAQIAEIARTAGAGADVTTVIADGSYLEGQSSFRAWVAAATERAGEDLDRLATPAILLDGEPLGTTYDWTHPGRLAAAIDAARD